MTKDRNKKNLVRSFTKETALLRNSMELNQEVAI